MVHVKAAKLPPVHPGETLRADFLKPFGLSANRLAAELHGPLTRINGIALGRRYISADTALCLARYFGTSPQFWIDLQANYDLEVTLDASAALVGSQVKPRRAARSTGCRRRRRHVAGSQKRLPPVHPGEALQEISTPRAVRRLPTTIYDRCADHPPGDSCQFHRWLRLHGDGRSVVPQPPDLG